MKNIRRYIHGILVGMIGEYLFRVEFNIFPLIIIILMGILVLHDVIENWNK